ncbi:dipeptide ABC transporter ATP-binding protein [Acidihalobacter ferrooxydans]|uniref:ABC-type dipeptide transporter n=1 Tax=Acidihalobacter ferrooxydans TaxID=1765967 RepID=A0A1P8UES4_9GAMM|nr:dipeptide ABC transporter ATP-binding protein [Acidihalobacter ferrooxydans]APZ42347.1 glutathione ABC transporter ATP-binding protein [Acidihalobacter ferrooxydans]
MSEPPLIAIDSLSIAYRRAKHWHRAVSDLTLRIAPGAAYGLVGESGCGKSTAAMALLRYLPRNGRIESGRITFDGQDLLALSAEQLRQLRGNRIGMVYQHPGSALNPALRIGRQIAEMYTTHRTLDRRDAHTAAIDMLGRLQIADPAQVAMLYPHELSGGMQQRVVIAMALATDPDLLILDEPTTALDATVQAEILDLFAALRREFSAALLFISHNLGVVRQVCDRIGVMYAGELVEEGPADGVFLRPRHPYTAALLACIPDTTGPALAGRVPLAHIPGLLPEPGTAIQGCRFRERCTLAQADCAVRRPPFVVTGEAQLSLCLHADTVPEPRAAQAANTVDVTAPERRPTLLQAHGLRLAYGDTTVLREINLELASGETFGLVGESGSGKTTLAKLLAGLLRPDAGALSLAGDTLANLAARRTRTQRRALQMVFQSPDGTLNPSHRVGSILKRAIKVLGKNADTAARLQALLLDTSLPDAVARRRPAALSGGQRQRVAIARAFAGQPELVILDEPTSALDVSVQATILNLLAELQREHGVSYLFITHDLAVVYHLAHRIGVMYLGELVEVGPTAQVFAPPYHPYTEALLAAAPRLHGDDRPAAPRLRGQNPGAANRPAGCAFHTRCPHSRAVCTDQAPPSRATGHGHTILCHIPLDELRGLQSERRD